MMMTMTTPAVGRAGGCFVRETRAGGCAGRTSAVRCEATTATTATMVRASRGRVGWTRRRASAMRSAATRASAEDVDEDEEDAQARKMAIEFAVIADDTRAVEVQVLKVSKSVYWARYLVLATAFNRPQMNACCAKMRDLANDEYGLVVPKSAAQQGDWACLDCSDVVVHVFSPSSRTHYDLDGLYKNAEQVELPFVTETREQQDEFGDVDYDDEDDFEDDDEDEDEFEVFK